MQEEVRVVLDAMGGDHAPEEIVKGAVQAAKEISGTVSIIGREERINECLQALNWNGDNIEVVNATEVISNNESPAMAVRKKKDSSIVVSQRLVREGKADAFVSAGSTGAVLVGSQVLIGRIRGIERPALAPLIPTTKGFSLLIDCGANVDAKPSNLVQFA